MRQFPSEVDGAGLRLLAVFPPISIDDFFDDVGIQKCGERGKALDRDAEANRHPDHRDKLSAPIRDGRRTAGMDALAVRGATRSGKTGEVIVNIAAKTLGKFLPSGLGDLERRLGERL